MKPAALALGAVCLLVGGTTGFLLAKNATALALPGDTARPAPADAAVLTELRELSTHVAQLQDAVAGLRMAPDRQPAPLPANAPATPTELDPLVTRLSALVERLAAAASTRAHEALRVARLQRSQPDVAAAETLQRQLHESKAAGKPARLAVEREWMLLGMDEVVLRLGMPSEVAHSQDGNLLWSYQRPDGEQVIGLYFRDGVVVAVRD